MADFNFYLNKQGIQGRKGDKGEDGFSPTITVDTETLNDYTLRITNENSTIVTPNLRGNRPIKDNGGTYVRVEADGSLSASTADLATSEKDGVVRLSTPEDITNMSEITVVTPSTLADALSKYIEAGTPNVTITQDEITDKTQISVDTSDITARLDIAEEDITRMQEHQNQVDGLVANNVGEIANLERNKQDKLVAGKNITIEGNVISAEGGKLPTNLATTDTDQELTGKKTFTKAPISNDKKDIIKSGIGKQSNWMAADGSTIEVKTPSISIEPASINSVEAQALSGEYYQETFDDGTISKTVIKSPDDIILKTGLETQGNIKLNYTREPEIRDKDNNIILSQGNVTAGDNVKITKTARGIKIDATGGSADNVVTTDTPQEITASKTFTDNQAIKSNTLDVHTDRNKSGGELKFLDKNGVNVGTLHSYVNNNSTPELRMVASNGNQSAFAGLGITTDGQPFFEVPEPAANANNSDAPTTKWVNDKLAHTLDIDVSNISEAGKEAIKTIAGGGGAAPANMVTTDTNQTITSNKLFTCPNNGAKDECGISFNNPTNSGWKCGITAKNIGGTPCLYFHAQNNNSDIMFHGDSIRGAGSIGRNIRDDVTNFYIGIPNSNAVASFFDASGQKWVKTYGNGHLAKTLNTYCIEAGDGVTVTPDDTKGTVTISATGGGSAPENMVTTDTEQTITATKTFQDVWLWKNNAGGMGIIPNGNSSNGSQYIRITDRVSDSLFSCSIGTKMGGGSVAGFGQYCNGIHLSRYNSNPVGIYASKSSTDRAGIEFNGDRYNTVQIRPYSFSGGTGLKITPTDLLFNDKSILGGGGAEIDDTTPAADKVYSSQKIEELIGQINSILDSINSENNAYNNALDDINGEVA